MAQALISPCGEVVHKRHKVRLSGGQRYIWSDGLMSDLKVLDTPVWPMGDAGVLGTFPPNNDL